MSFWPAGNWQRQQQEWFQAAAAQSASQNSIEAAVAEATAATYENGAVQAMRYEEILHKVGDLTISPDAAVKRAWITLPGEFGRAIGIVCSLNVGDGDTNILQAMLCTSLGQDWYPLTPAGGNATLTLQRHSGFMWRVHGPFGNTVGIICSMLYSTTTSEISGTWHDVVVRAGVQFAE